MAPMWDPVSSLVWSADRKIVDTLIIDAIIVLGKGVLISIEESAVSHKGQNRGRTILLA
jgi:hypothetical protein